MYKGGINLDKERNVIIDNLKGIAAICVILGHSIQRANFAEFQDNTLYKILLTFHMPLFMLLAGYTFYYSRSKNDKNYLLKRAKRLLWPTMVWTYILYFFRKCSFTGLNIINWYDSIWLHTKQFLLHPDALIWFLYVVFVCTLIFYIGLKVFENHLLVYLGVITIIIYLLPESYYGIWKLRLHLPIFIAGYYIAKYKDVFLKYFKFTLIPSMIYYLVMFNRWNYYSSNVYQWLTAFAGITILYYIVRNINNKIFNRIFGFLGRYSLELYLCQCICLNIGFGTGTVRICTIFISATIISILLAYYTRKFKLTRAVLYGAF